ncbi:peptidase G2 autoproteolytic cleavage domain-containing protein [Clostridium botulinum]|uniref:peptidase G2 autoproteolytic cleavage domain-containing protein n=1 Tax=Clostridium botulinum TaxID=1491 RepID=UPI001F19EDF1|nr:peptidase G2 autoproteolytic cleavage domain-containing protein [Clostridium botulinum]
MDCGYFVTLDGEKICKADESDDYVLGITSATPAVIANSGDLNWKDKYVTDEWGRVLYQDVLVPAVTSKDGRAILPERTESQPVLNPVWDHTREFIPRCKRPEWVAVGLLGKILVRDDGTCQVNRYCRPNKEGIATASRYGYRVMKRIGENQVLVFFDHMRLGHLKNR